MVAINQEVLNVFGFWSAILVLKLLAMVGLTVRQRFTKKIFLNPDDTTFAKGGKVAYDDPDIERVRRSHRNDLENVLPWFIITFVWLTTNPATWLATILIRTFVLSRIAHTLFYAVVPMQPHRAIAFFVGFAIIAFEAISTLLHYL